MRTNWRSYFDLPLNVREEMYLRGVDDEVKNFIEFEKALKGDPEEPEEDNFVGEEKEDLEFSGEQNGKIIIIKGDDPVMNEYNDRELNELLEIFAEEEFEFEKAEKELPKEAVEALKKAYKILLKYKDSMNKDLKQAMTVITRYIGIKYPYPEPYPVKKELEKAEIFDWKSFIEHMQDDEDIEEEIEKADPDDKFPSLTRGLLRGQKKRDKALSERDISMGRRFI